ncbi:hypothetical protein LJK88_12605 [Paenibacillus sp. P26]|nr:hypothetical protein LJK88_12605 [Paenibacillus sp. P26]UUZ89411.1 hypothetical protein LJK87_25050 [Paenibacillus sp. P25]
MENQKLMLSKQVLLSQNQANPYEGVFLWKTEAYAFEAGFVITKPCESLRRSFPLENLEEVKK